MTNPNPITKTYYQKCTKATINLDPKAKTCIIFRAQTIHEDVSTIGQDFQTFHILKYSRIASNKNVYDEDEIVQRAETVRSIGGRG